MASHSGFLFVSILLLALCGCDHGRELDPRFTAGRNALMKGDFATSITQMRDYLAAEPQGWLASRAAFLMAKAYVGQGNLAAARSQFEDTLRSYPDSEEAHKSKYKLGMLSYLEGDLAAARKRFADMVDHPDGTLVPEARAMLTFIDQLPANAPPAGAE